MTQFLTPIEDRNRHVLQMRQECGQRREEIQIFEVSREDWSAAEILVLSIQVAVSWPWSSVQLGGWADGFHLGFWGVKRD